MTKDNKFFDDMAKLASTTFATAANMKHEFSIMMKEQFKAMMKSMDFVTRKEFNALKKMASETKMELDALKKGKAPAKKPAAKKKTTTKTKK